MFLQQLSKSPDPEEKYINLHFMIVVKFSWSLSENHQKSMNGLSKIKEKIAQVCLLDPILLYVEAFHKSINATHMC